MKLTPPTVFPRYDGYCFANLPATIQYWLTGQGAPALAPELMQGFSQQYDRVILLFIDSLGWHFIEKYADEYPFLKRFARQGRLAKITSQFPSTTAAHVTCIHTGLPVGKSGIYEWQYYEPQLDAVITPLLFSFAGSYHRDDLKVTGIKPEALFPSVTLYQELAQYGVNSYTFGSRDFTPSTYSNVVMRGAKMQPFRPWGEALVNLGMLASKAPTPAYLVLYYGDIDGMCHQYGPDSPQARAEIDLVMHGLERTLMPYLSDTLKKTLVVLTADHGHMNISPQETRFVNLDPQLSGVLPWLIRDGHGEILPPGGSPRDSFWYVRDDALDDAYALLTRGLEGYADVVKTHELVQQGYFGKTPVCADLLARLGNLTILPYPHKCVWWYEKDKFELKFLGMHGGLSPTEMEIPLGLWDTSA